MELYVSMSFLRKRAEQNKDEINVKYLIHSQKVISDKITVSPSFG